MNQRTMSIISDIYEGEKVLTLEAIAQRCKVSQRTIRNDLHAINELLAAHGLCELTLGSGGVIEKQPDFARVMEFIDGSDFYTYKLSQEERKRVAAALLISSAEYITLSAIAEHLYVSRATVINDLDAIKDFISRGKLRVISHPNRGLRVEGAESDKRRFLMRLVDLWNAPTASGIPQKQTAVLAGNQLMIKKIVSEQEHVHKRFLTDEAYQGIVQYLGILVARVLQCEYIEPQTPQELSADAYAMAADILKYIAQYCDVVLTADETDYFAAFLARVRYMKKKPEERESVRIQMITRQFIEQISEELGSNLNDDYDFFENLSNHLGSVFAVAQPEYPANELIGEVAAANPQVLKAAKKHLSILQQYAGRSISEVELGYIVIHICAALERRKNKEVAFHVIVACHAGIGTSQLLMERLKKHFNFQIVDIISAHDAKHVKPSQADFIISTVPLSECRVEYVIVSPLLSDEDYLRIGNKIDTLRGSRHLPSRVEVHELTAGGLMERLAPVIHAIAPEKEQQLLKALKKEVRSYFHQTPEEEAQVLAPYLHNLLTPQHIQLDVACRDWREAVEKAAAPLLREGVIEPRYVRAMLQNIEENGPYIVISKGFAVPHEGLEQGSVRVGMNLIRLAQPVPFDAQELDPVEFVCCLSAVDHKTHLKAFFHLVNLLKQEAFLEGLRTCQTPEEATRWIERLEYQLE